MARQLVIVSRQHPDLYVYLRDRFAAEADVEVIPDRRVGERRGREVPVQHERRISNRRARPEVDEALRARSHVIVTIEVP